MSDSKKKLDLGLNPDDVKAYLKENPDFLIKNPDLFTVLTPPDRSTEDEVVDFQNLMITKIRDDLKELQNNQGLLIDTSRNNLTTQVQVHEAVISLLDADSIHHLSHIVTNDWADNLHIDVIRICFEQDHDIVMPDLKEVAAIEFGSVDKYLEKDDIIQLRGDVEVAEEIFGPAKPLIKAEALIRIPGTDHNPPGILAFGSRDADMFYPGQGTELLRFLGNAFHKCLVLWLRG